MIVKIPEKRRDNHSSFKALSDYITKEFNRDNIDINRPGFDQLTQYITRESVPDILSGIQVEKTIAVEIGNLNSLSNAAKEMYAVAEKNAKVDDPVYHYILSWPEHERPEARDMLAAARDTIAALGMAEHQYIIAIHANTDNLHAHIEVNRVHPQTFKSHNIEWSRKTLHHAAREAEIKYGWSHDNGIYNVIEVNGKKIIAERTKTFEQLPSEKSQLFEIWNREESLETWCRRQPAPVLKELLPTFQSWNDLHDTLHEFGLQLTDSGGGGMKISTLATDDQSPITISASKAFRFLKRPELEARLGTFTKPTEGDSHDRTNNTGNSSILDDGHPDNRPDAAQFARYQQRAAELGQRTSTRVSVSESGAATTCRQRQTATGSILHHLSDVPLVQDIERNEMLLPADAPTDLDDLEAQSDLDMRRPIPRSASGRSKEQQIAPKITYQRDPEKRLAAKLERAEVRRALLARYTSEKIIHKTVRSQMLIEAKERQTTRLKTIQADKAARRLAVLKDKRLTPEQKHQAYSLLAHQIAMRKEEAQIKTADERQQLSAAFKTLPINSYRSWVEDLAGQGDEAAIAALRGIIYQEGRDRKKQVRDEEIEDDKKQKARIVAPEGGTHDPKKAFNLGWQIHGGKLYFTYPDGKLAFADNGDNISWDRAMVDDDALRLSLRHAAEKWGRKLTINGGDEAFQQRLARTAKDLGLEIANVQLLAITAPVPVDEVNKIIVPTTRVTRKAKQRIQPTDPASPLSATVPGGSGGGRNPLDDLISDVRSRNQDSVVTNHDPANTRVQRGKIIASNTEYVAQQLTKNTVVIHHRVALKQVVEDGQSVAIRYDANGKATVTKIVHSRKNEL